MLDYFDENDDMGLDDIDVQVGPDHEITASFSDDAIENPISGAKSDPNTIPVAKTNEGYFVDCKDIVNFSKLEGCNMMETLNNVIACNEGVAADNIHVVIDESTMKYVNGLESYGVQCTRYVHEGDVGDVTVDVQVGPNDNEVSVAEDPQTVNPVDAVKRDYNNVVVAKRSDDEFFTDVEDVQKCAELNCESVIETLNGIIACHEADDITAANLKVLIHGNTDPDIRATLESAGVQMVIEEDEI
mgnify:FL=1